MSQNTLTIKKNYKADSLKIFFYIPQAKRENIQPLIKFLQKHQLPLQRLQEKTFLSSLSPFSDLIRNANFFVQGYDNFTSAELEFLASFLFSNVTVIAFFYQNKIWNVSRFVKLKKKELFLPSLVVTKQLRDFKKNLQKFCF